MSKTIKNATSTVVAKINEVEILVINDPDQPIPIKPICDLFGIGISGQSEKIKNDEILGSVIRLSRITGNDGKQYEMMCIPYRYIFGWLFTINPKNVAPDAKEKVLQYKQMCYDALFDHFVGARKFLEEKETIVHELDNELDLVCAEMEKLKSRQKELKEKREKAILMTFEQYRDGNRQLNFPWWNDTLYGGQGGE